MAEDRLQSQRFELKYRVSPTTALGIRDFVSSHLVLDEFSRGQPDNSYYNHSIYLDSDDLKLYWDVINGNINLLKQGQSEVLNGNLLTLPVGGGLLYVQPVFVQASSGTQLPALRKILVAFGDKVAFEDTLQDALDALFGGDSGADAGDTDVPATPSPTETPTPGETTDPQPTTPPTDDYQAALEEARQAILDRQALQEQPVPPEQRDQLVQMERMPSTGQPQWTSATASSSKCRQR